MLFRLYVLTQRARAQGDRIILELQCARFLLSCADAVISSGSVSTLSDVCSYMAPLAQARAIEALPLRLSSGSPADIRSVPRLVCAAVCVCICPRGREFALPLGT